MLQAGPTGSEVKRTKPVPTVRGQKIGNEAGFDRSFHLARTPLYPRPCPDVPCCYLSNSRMLKRSALDALLKSRLREGRVSLFLGAGASTGCRNLMGNEPPLSGMLMRVLADAMKLPLGKAETLRSVTTAARRRLGADFDEILRTNYTILKTSNEYSVLSQYPWSRIYTLNVDDGLEGALHSQKTDHRIFYHKQPLFDIGRSTASTNVIKLSGSVDRLYDGIIFSEEEYASALNKVSWYETVVADYLSGSTFVFIGTLLDEPLFHYHLTRLSAATERAPATAYLVVPELSEIAADNFR